MGNVYWNNDLNQATNQDSSISIHVLAIGDSWFHYAPCCLLTHIRKQIGSRNIYALGANGARADGMGAYLAEVQNSLKTYRTITVVAISAGGNDFAGTGDLDTKILNPNCRNANDIEDCYQPEQPDKLFREVIEHYKQLIDAVIHTIQGTNRRIVVFLHNYDYPIPDGRFVQVILKKFGPWLKKPMETCKVNDQEAPLGGLRRQICFNLIDKFTAEIEKLADEYKGNPFVDVQVTNSAGTLDDSALHWKEDWDNELHPSVKGFKKIVKKCWAVPMRKALGLTV